MLSIQESRSECLHLRRVRIGSWEHLAAIEDLEDDSEDSDPQEDNSADPSSSDEQLEEGDRIFATVIHRDDPAHLRATATVSQRLAEASRSSKSSAELPDYIKDMEDVFSKTSFDTLPDRKRWDHAIELLPGSKPTNCKVYPISPSEQTALDEFLEENLSTGRIRPSKSPMASPVFFVKKKDGSLRFVQDYRSLNAMTIKNQYSLPLISDLIHQLRGARYFTKLDVRWGFNNVRIKEGDKWKAAFRTNRGLFEPLVMYFGLTNSPSTFQTMMNDFLHDFIAQGHVCVYMDDILIFTEDLKEHHRIVRAVLERLRLHKLYLKLEKCEFEKTKIEYLGVIISYNSVEMDPVKVAGVRDWPIPKDKVEVQSFLGFANFY